MNSKWKTERGNIFTTAFSLPTKMKLNRCHQMKMSSHEDEETLRNQVEGSIAGVGN